MPDYVYLIMVILLFVLAFTDLIVGVSNDAVNFLNSSIGSKVAPRHIIMIVASLGIFIGAATSDGMMDLARNKMLAPEQFMFGEIMIIFLAVMITDIILLDLFNTFGMPTSTTVSIVFELLGAATMISLLSLNGADQGLGHLGEFIKAEKAIAVISGIFLAVLFAFTIGAAVQWFSRLLFTFDYRKKWKWVGPVWGAIALTFISYFLIIKGMKHASFITESAHEFIDSYLPLMLIGSFLLWAGILKLLLSVFRVNIMRIVVLFGTFALAMAFAGNDLVNFIGVPLAGLESFQAWKGSGVGPMEFNMGDTLNAANAGKSWMLMIAGGIMVATLWFSRKAQSVTETEVNLGRQEEGVERFSSNPAARGLVRMIVAISRDFPALGGGKLKAKIDQRFEPYVAPIKPDEQPPAFDLIRASVNLTVASILIAIGTSLQLPLSTTYVGFMVAMGTSLADRAWGRDSAVFRVSGVMSVIGGWFLTGIIAFSAAALFALLIHFFGIWAIGALVALAAFSLIRSTVHHKKQEAKKIKDKTAVIGDQQLTANEIRTKTRNKASKNLGLIQQTFQDAITGLLTEDRKILLKVHTDMLELKEQNEKFRYDLVRHIRKTKKDGGQLYLDIYDFEEDLVQSITHISEVTLDHVQNLHSPMKEAQTAALSKVQKTSEQFLRSVATALKSEDKEATAALEAQKNQILTLIDESLKAQTEGIQREEYGARNSLLFFSILMETKDLVAVAHRLLKLYMGT